MKVVSLYRSARLVDEKDIDSRDIRVLMQVPCERCEGSGRVEWDSPTPGGYAADQTKPCPDCSERGHVETAVGLPELKRLLGL